MEQYISKSALVAEIGRRLKVHMESNHGFSARYDELKDIRSFLDTLEVEEVDLEYEWVKYFENRGDMATVNIKHLAKYFFELGLKAQKGE